MPTSTPPITVPSALPRWAGGARSAASGTNTCAATLVTPTSATAGNSSVSPGAAADQGQPHRGEEAEPDEQAAALDQVAQRHDQGESDDEADLADGHEQPDHRRADVEPSASSGSSGCA